MALPQQPRSGSAADCEAVECLEAAQALHGALRGAWGGLTQVAAADGDQAAGEAHQLLEADVMKAVVRVRGCVALQLSPAPLLGQNSRIRWGVLPCDRSCVTRSRVAGRSATVTSPPFSTALCAAGRPSRPPAAALERGTRV